MIRIDKDLVFDQIAKRSPKAVAFNAPDGLLSRARQLADEVYEKFDIPAFVIADPSYGICDTVDEDAKRLKADIAFHIGHTVSIPRIGERTIIVSAYDDIGFDKVVQTSLALLKQYPRIGLCTNSQHLQSLDDVKKALEEKGFKVVIGKGAGLLQSGQVFGCEFYPAYDTKEDVDAFVFLGQSRFHAIGIALSTGKPTVMLDPYLNEAIDVNPEASKLHRHSVFNVYKAVDARKFGLIVGLKEGQQDMKRIFQLRDRLQFHGRKVSFIALREITNDRLMLFPDLEVFIQTGCPRISTDGMLFSKPVLSVPQALTLISIWEGKKPDDFLETRHWL